MDYFFLSHPYTPKIAAQIQIFHRQSYQTPRFVSGNAPTFLEEYLIVFYVSLPRNVRLSWRKRRFPCRKTYVSRKENVENTLTGGCLPKEVFYLRILHDFGTK